MRTTLEIEIAVIDAKEDVTDEELRLCVAAQASLIRFYQEALNDLIDGAEKPAGLKFKAMLAKKTRERLWNARKKPPAEWLGPGNIPGSAEQQRRLAIGKAIFKKATGIDLDSDE
jgi:hypothetical protein